MGDSSISEIPVKWPLTSVRVINIVYGPFLSYFDHANFLLIMRPKYLLHTVFENGVGLVISMETYSRKFVARKIQVLIQ